MGCGSSKAAEVVDGSKPKQLPQSLNSKADDKEKLEVEAEEEGNTEAEMDVLREFYSDKEVFDKRRQDMLEKERNSRTGIADRALQQAAPPAPSPSPSSATATTAPVILTANNAIPFAPMAGVVAVPAIHSQSQESATATADRTQTTEDLVHILPSIGYVVKTKDLKTGEKIFVNVMMFPSLKNGNMIAVPAQLSVDKKGEQSKSYGVVVTAKVLEKCRENPDVTHQLSERVVQYVNSQFDECSLDSSNVKVPKIKRGYVGVEEISTIGVPKSVVTAEYIVKVVEADRMVAANEERKKAHQGAAETATTIASDVTVVSESDDVPPPPAPSTAEVGPADPSALLAKTESQAPTDVAAPPSIPSITSPPVPPVVASKDTCDDSDDEDGASNANLSALTAPPIMKGWLKKQGHQVLNWKRRYFVLDNGYLTYYTDMSELPPFGKGVKGNFCLAAFRRDLFELANNVGNRFLFEKRPEMGFDPTPSGENKRRTSMSGVERDVEHMLFEADSSEDKQAWCDALEKHALYIEAVLRHDMAELSAAEAAASDASDPVVTAAAQASSTVASVPNSTVSASSSPSVVAATSSIVPPQQRSTSVFATAARSRSVGGGPNDARKWMIFLQKGESVILTGPLFKPNPVGVKHVRQLILTNKPRLVYVDPQKMELKGDIVWKKGADISVKKLDDKSFEVAVRSLNRTYKFVSIGIDDENPTVEEWVESISVNSSVNGF